MRVWWITVATAALLSGSPAIAADGAAPFYERSDEGWFFYEPEPEPPPEPEPAPPPPPPAPAVAAPPSEPVDPGPPAFSVAWLRAEMERAQERAVDNPTEENVRYYYYLQRAAMDKAQTYAEVAQRVVAGDPFIDETARRGTASYASKAIDKRQTEGTDKTLTALAERVGVFFFFRGDCGAFCAKQAEVLQAMQRLYGFEVFAVSLDGKPLPNGLFPDFRTDEGQVKALGIEVIPAIYLAKPPNEVAPIAQGIVAITDLRTRFLFAAAGRGWISPDEFAASRAFEPTPTFRTSPEEMEALDIDYADPSAVVRALRTKMMEDAQ